MKSGDKGWKVLIPLYGEYCMYKAVDSAGLFWATLVLSVLGFFLGRMIGLAASGSAVLVIYALVVIIAALTIAIKFSINTAHAFGKSGGFTAGLFFLQPIFIGILAFGSARHWNQGSLTETEQTY